MTTLWSSEAGIETGDGAGGIWSPGALRSDGPGQLIVTTGNGYDPTAPAAGNANPPPGQLAEAVVRLTVQPDGSLKTTDFFIPLDANALNQIDGDLGSGSPVHAPEPVLHPHLSPPGGGDREGGVPLRPRRRRSRWVRAGPERGRRRAGPARARPGGVGFAGGVGRRRRVTCTW